MAIDFSQKKILVIDDFPEMRHSLKRMMQSFGAVHIHDADRGEKAIPMMQETPYDIVLCDYNLGTDRKDGQQVLEEAKLRKLIRFSTIFMMITAEQTMEMVMGAVEYRPDDYLTKPFTKDMLKHRLERLIAKKSDLHDIEEAADRKDYRRAIALCDEKIAANPRNVLEFYRLKGELCRAIGDYDAALSVYDKVLTIRDLPWARVEQGRIQYLKKDYEDARQTFESVLEVNKNYIEAYDWLAKTLVGLGDTKHAQAVLDRAVALSPKGIRRQKILGEVSLKNGDLDSAERSYKAAIRLGKHSVLKEPSDFTGLAKVLVESNRADQALEVVHSSRKEFRDLPQASLQVAAMEGVIYKKLDREDEARKAVEEATRLCESLGGEVSTEVAMDVAKACFAVGEKGKATEIVQAVVRNHHEDEAVLKQAEDVFRGAELQDEGRKLIEDTRREIIDVNNKGVYLVREGKLDEAIDYFEKAASGLPENRTINLNAAQALLMHMQRNGRSDGFLHKSREYLQRVARMDPGSEKFQKLMAIYERIAAA
jgi:tetratricopeptide (TPR) repeat protein